ncbi:unnamed protein product [Oncorhynchus mykiss]|uniref:Uncharacterized protein n=1 Tax=Oncorhynchus mykiss TaxID=8022 RepID=A0A060YR88_ONCMY|nr:unnamed protein product [Oncorhynchus mykiss]
MRQSLPRPHTEVKCIEGDSLQDRFRAPDVTTPLRASVLSGLVEVGGAAGYLNYPVQSTLQDRVTLQYRTTTRLDMLSHRVLQGETEHNERQLSFCWLFSMERKHSLSLTANTSTDKGMQDERKPRC